MFELNRYVTGRSIIKSIHDDVIKWKHFQPNWPFVRGIHRSPVKSPHKGQWRGALMFSLICVWINDSVNNREAGDLRRYRAHYYVIVMSSRDVYFIIVYACCVKMLYILVPSWLEIFTQCTYKIEKEKQSEWNTINTKARTFVYEINTFAKHETARIHSAVMRPYDTRSVWKRTSTRCWITCLGLLLIKRSIWD